MNGKAVALGVAKGLGWTIVFGGLTLLFTLWGFPDEEARQYAEVQASELSGSKVTVGDLNVGFGQAALTDVLMRLEPLPPPTGPGAPPPDPKAKPKPRLVQAARLAADVSLMSLLFGSGPEVDLDIELQGGTITDANVRQTADGGVAVDIGRIEGVRLGPAKLLQGLAGVDIAGVLGGTVEMRLPPEGLEETTALVDLAVSGTVVKEPTVPTKQLGPIKLSDLDLGELQLKLRMDKVSNIAALKRGRGRARNRGAERTVIHFEDVGAAGADAEIEFDPTSVIRLKPGEPMTEAELDVHFAVQFKESYLDKTVVDADGEESQPNKILRMAMKSDRRIKAAMRDGVLGVGCKGTLGRPVCEPERPRIRTFKKRRPKFSGGAAPDGATDEAPKPDEEPDEEPTAEERPPQANGPGSATGRGRVASPGDRAGRPGANRPGERSTFRDRNRRGANRSAPAANRGAASRARAQPGAAPLRPGLARNVRDRMKLPGVARRGDDQDDDDDYVDEESDDDDSVDEEDYDDEESDDDDEESDDEESDDGDDDDEESDDDDDDEESDDDDGYDDDDEEY